MGCGNFQRKGKFQVNLNKGLCLLFRAEPQMKRLVCNKDAIKEQAPNQNIPSSLKSQLSSSSTSIHQVQLIKLSLDIKIISFKQKT